jgi:hypothetical protein
LNTTHLVNELEVSRKDDEAKGNPLNACHCVAPSEGQKKNKTSQEVKPWMEIGQIVLKHT